MHRRRWWDRKETIRYKRRSLPFSSGDELDVMLQPFSEIETPSNCMVGKGVVFSSTASFCEEMEEE